jgi:bifunctional DNA-binding transcriptional regulator/antitoxin component of YhaV-PrlF toxin-antitoxin module
MMPNAAQRDTSTNKNPIPDKKIVSISSKRQITIPQKFFTRLGFETEAECILRDNELVIRPAKINSGGEFATEILADLIARGLSGEELLAEFKKTQSAIRPAVQAMLNEAKQAAAGKADFATYDEVFGDMSDSAEEKQ